ncbi:XkdQ/YqbQ family protein [Hathewaya massiliensis]|uniref:XkdQ/YqbQ family protein n=1 Tax=Hathewaya massiliensis TaxID=1964382 RepID=UPI001FAA24F0|nr:hypothetical protein [Hathewaya massiliensis]
MPRCKVEIYKKNGYRGFKEEDSDKLILEESLLNIRLSRSEGTPTGEAIVVAQYENLDTPLFGGGDKGIIDNFAQIKVYVNKKIQFTGVIKKYTYDTDQKTMELTCHDMYYRMLNSTDKELKFYNKTAVEIITTVAQEAGLNIVRTGGNDYVVPKLEVDIGTMFHDIIEAIVETMHAKIRATKDGTILLEDQYPAYDEVNHENNKYDFDLNTEYNIADDKAGRDASLMRNILKIVCNDKYTLFEDTSMTKYLNGERWVDTIENPLATTEALRKAVAGHKYLDMWRKSTGISIVPVAGTSEMDIGKIARVRSKGTYSGYYLIVGVDTEITADGYTDSLQLQGMRDKTTIYNIPTKIGSGSVSGKSKSNEQTFILASANVKEKFRIDKSGRIKLGFIDIEKQPHLEVTAFFSNLLETKHYDLVLQDPNKSYYGYKQQIFTSAESPLTNTGLNSCESISYSGWSGQPEYFKIIKPMQGRWYIYLQSDTTEDYEANISVNLEWKKVQIDS